MAENQEVKFETKILRVWRSKATWKATCDGMPSGR